jgi:hypothetical protein
MYFLLFDSCARFDSRLECNHSPTLRDLLKKYQAKKGHLPKGK